MNILFKIYIFGCLLYFSYPPTPNTPGSNTPSNNDYPGAPQQGNPALAQALVAAAATASATATATATMMMQNDPQMNNNQPMNVQMNYGPGMQVIYFKKIICLGLFHKIPCLPRDCTFFSPTEMKIN